MYKIEQSWGYFLIVLSKNINTNEPEMIVKYKSLQINKTLKKFEKTSEIDVNL